MGAGHTANVPLPGPRPRIVARRSTRFLFSRLARSIIQLPMSSLKGDYIPGNKKKDPRPQPDGPQRIQPVRRSGENIQILFFKFSTFISVPPAPGKLTVPTWDL